MGDGSDAAGRVGQPDDITPPIAVFLASDDPAWLTGEILVASGACAKDSHGTVAPMVEA
jgi:NAD(P)-dependent dehydrogenase (short-subunit alcohol dehydrogenase family)